MTAVASQPTFPQLSRPAWGTLNGNGSMNSDESRGMFVPRKTLPRSNSASSIASTASTTTVASNGAQSNGTSMSSTSDLSSWSGGAAARNRPQPKAPWQVGKPEAQSDYSRQPAGRPNGMAVPQSPMQAGVAQPQMSPQGMMRPPSAEPLNPAQPVLYLLSLNGTFERKTISVPFAPDSLRIGRQTNQKTVPTPSNGFFDSKVLSRQHAEIFAERNGKVYIRDVKSSNGTFVNGTRLSQENRESEPHELQTADHLELGIDIVSEDQKTVVHHKVAAKVEHSGFLNTSNNVMDMNFGDLDPANSSMMMPTGAAQMRGRVGSNASMGNNRMLPSGPVNASNVMQQQQRPFFFTPVATDQILKRLTNEMRSAKLQSQDLNRTNAFINTLLSKDDVKDLDKPDGLDPPKPPPMINGNVLPFRGDAKTRFSDPPAPPPQQPLPEKPAAGSLKRGTERPSPGATGASPIRQDNQSQVKELIEALNTAKRDFDSQSVRMRELENMLQKEREARELAEDLARRLEESAATHVNGTEESNDVESDETSLPTPDAKAKEPIPAVVEAPQSEAEPAADTATQLQARIDHMEGQMKQMTESLREWQERCKVAEAERDHDRKTLAEMVIQLRAEEARRSAAKEKSRSRSRKGRTDEMADESTESVASAKQKTIQQASVPAQSDGAASEDDPVEDASPAQVEAKTALDTRRSGSLPEQHLQAGLPYASMVGVVFIGMGLMAYINGWQPQPSRLDQ